MSDDDHDRTIDSTTTNTTYYYDFERALASRDITKALRLSNDVLSRWEESSRLFDGSDNDSEAIIEEEEGSVDVVKLDVGCDRIMTVSLSCALPFVGETKERERAGAVVLQAVHEMEELHNQKVLQTRWREGRMVVESNQKPLHEFLRVFCPVRLSNINAVPSSNRRVVLTVVSPDLAVMFLQFCHGCSTQKQLIVAIPLALKLARVLTEGHARNGDGDYSHSDACLDCVRLVLVDTVPYLRDVEVALHLVNTLFHGSSFLGSRMDCDDGNGGIDGRTWDCLVAEFDGSIDAKLLQRVIKVVRTFLNDVISIDDNELDSGGKVGHLLLRECVAICLPEIQALSPKRGSDDSSTDRMEKRGHELNEENHYNNGANENDNSNNNGENNHLRSFVSGAMAVAIISIVVWKGRRTMRHRSRIGLSMLSAMATGTAREITDALFS